MSEKEKCEGCGRRVAAYGVVVADTDGRLYLPCKELAQEDGSGESGEGFVHPGLRNLQLCHPCKRFLEDNFRACVAYLQTEHGLKFTQERSSADPMTR